MALSTAKKGWMSISTPQTAIAPGKDAFCTVLLLVRLDRHSFLRVFIMAGRIP